MNRIENASKVNTAPHNFHSFFHLTLFLFALRLRLRQLTYRNCFMPEQWLEWLCIFRQNAFAFCLSHSHKADSALLLFLFRSSFYPFDSLCARIRSTTLHVTCNAFALVSFAFAYSNIKLLTCGYVLMLQLIMCVCVSVCKCSPSFILSSLL